MLRSCSSPAWAAVMVVKDCCSCALSREVASCRNAASLFTSISSHDKSFPLSSPYPGPYGVSHRPCDWTHHTVHQETEIQQVGRALSLADTQTGRYWRLYSRRRLGATRSCRHSSLLSLFLRRPAPSFRGLTSLRIRPQPYEFF
jgi:hypothetical protein